MTMPAMERSGRLQKALLWNLIGYDPEGENVVSTDPIEIDVRSDLRKGTGGSGAIRSSLVVDRAIEVGSIVKLDNLENWAGTGSGGVEGDYLKVTSYSEAKDVKAREIRRSVELELYRGTPPSRD